MVNAMSDNQHHSTKKQLSDPQDTTRPGALDVPAQFSFFDLETTNGTASEGDESSISPDGDGLGQPQRSPPPMRQHEQTTLAVRFIAPGDFSLSPSASVSLLAIIVRSYRKRGMEDTG